MKYLFLPVFLLIACAPHPENKLVIVTSTTLIASVAQAVGGNRVKVSTIAPAGMCPGQFDLKPSDIAAANKADLLINHGWEAWFDQLVKAINNPKVHHVTTKIADDWMLPAVQKQEAFEMAGFLSELDTVAKDSFKMRAEIYCHRIDSVADLVRQMFKGKKKPKLLAAAYQAPFLAWLGFDVVATYGRPEEITGRELTHLAKVGIDSGVGIIVDNLQSGPDAGLELARSLNAKHVTLTNFPLQGKYLEALKENAQSLAGLLE